jgi:hypothetical protein
MAAIALAGAALIGGACGSDHETLPSAPRFAKTSSTAPSATSINTLITQLFPPPGLLTAARSQFTNVQRVLGQGNVADAQAKAIALAGYALQRYSNHQLIGNQSAATLANLQSFIDQLFQFVGLGPAAIPPGALGPDGAVAMVGPTGGLVVTGSQLAGVSFPAGALPQNVIVTISRSANQSNPLPTVLEQFPLFYDFKTFPEVPQFGQLVTVGVCVLDDPVAEAGVDPANLRLAHPLHSDPSAIEILPLAPQNFVDPTLCQNASVPVGALQGPMSDLASATSTIGHGLFWLMMGAPRDLHASESRRMMMPGGLGGGVKSFSTFGAVDFTSSSFVPYQEIGYRFLQLGPEQTPPSNFEQPSFDASEWSTGQGAFGGGSACSSLTSTIHTTWPAASEGDTVEILLRKRFSGTAQNVHIQVAVDNDVRVFVNGTEITDGFVNHEGCAFDGLPTQPFDFAVDNGLLSPTGNLVVVEARDRGVMSYIDVRVTGTLPSP